MATSNPIPNQALDEAIARAGRFGWRLVRRRRRSAELRDASGANRLYLEVGADGSVRDRQASGAVQPAGESRPGFRLRPHRLAVLAVLTLLLGVAAGLALVLAPSARARVGAAPAVPLTAPNVEHTLQRPPLAIPAASFAHLSVAVSGDSVVLAVQPRLLSGADALTVASSDMLEAAASIFHAFPDAAQLTVALFGSSGSAPGPKPVQLLVQLTLSAQTTAHLDVPALAGRVLADNTVVFCQADSYRIAPLIYQQLVQERQSSGCLAGPNR